MKKNALKKLLNNPERESTESTVSEQSAVSGSVRSSGLRLTGESFEKGDDIKEMKSQHHSNK